VSSCSSRKKLPRSSAMNGSRQYAECRAPSSQRARSSALRCGNRATQISNSEFRVQLHPPLHACDWHLSTYSEAHSKQFTRVIHCWPIHIDHSVHCSQSTKYAVCTCKCITTATDSLYILLHNGTATQLTLTVSAVLRSTSLPLRGACMLRLAAAAIATADEVLLSYYNLTADKVYSIYAA
jgi:hypothetical protein